MIVLAATPIGNLSEASPRLIETLETADVIAAEDTRRTRQLLHALQIETKAQLLSFYDHNERERVDELVEIARTKTVVVVSDAGMPAISDPGYRFVDRAHSAGVALTAVAGPSAPLTALALSGLPTDRFVFEGFVPRKGSERRARFEELSAEVRTMVFFESPKRLEKTLAVAAEIFGSDRLCAICRELTKLHEEVVRCTLRQAQARAAKGLRGEIVLVIAGKERAHTWSLEEARAALAAQLAAGERLKTASKSIAARSGIPARTLYDLFTSDRKA